ncbi:uncharacterized protein MKK02DRAFT_42763 [Dioszegia hungarica]|uniref:Myb-like domain-containing protein n=1 Tax=Dioszegia hungarica TaxID=4972 RepID=A0AA38HDC1_9TREE|nr:uncharacterized protein MKK02DRAFT_42763 [Dioszegia hungarica]KAI9638376.1 hypothetical protein MKK02DRAFT_42763 [Dioszegia hungarica]
MAKAAANPKATKPKPATKPKAPPKRKPAMTPDSEGESEMSAPGLSLDLDKTLVLRLALAKIEACKSFDWHELARKLGEKEGVVGQAKGRRKKKDEGKKAWTGTELHELFQYTILPALRSGRPLWAEDAVAGEIYLPSSPLPARTKFLSAEPVIEVQVDDEETAAGSGGEEGTTVTTKQADSDSVGSQILQGELNEVGSDMDNEKVEEELEEVMEAAAVEVVETWEVEVEVKKAGKVEKKRPTPPRLTTTYGKKAQARPSYPPPTPRQIDAATKPPSGSTGGGTASSSARPDSGGKKRIRPAYSDEEEEVEPKRRSKPSPASTPAARRQGGGRTAKKGGKYAEESGSEAE